MREDAGSTHVVSYHTHKAFAECRIGLSSRCGILTWRSYTHFHAREEDSCILSIACRWAAGAPRSVTSVDPEAVLWPPAAKRRRPYMASTNSLALLLLLHNHHHHSQPSVWAYTPRKVMAIDREAAEERLLATGNGVLHRVHSFWSNFAGK